MTETDADAFVETSDREEPQASPAPWWGTFPLELGTGGRWEVGPSTLWLYRTEREWRIIHRPSTDPESADPMENRSEAVVPISDEEMKAVFDSEDTHLQTHRYSFGSTEKQVALEPALADRPVVTRPEDPMYIPSGETITLYLNMPLWMRVFLPKSERLLQEVPSHRMSDTWFGKTTTQGEFCYAARTTGRIRLDDLPFRFHRALTPLRIRNTAEDALFLERVQLPTRHLALYRNVNDVLWTQSVRMTRKEGNEGADIRILDGPPSDIEGGELLREPRDTNKRNLFTSTFGAVGSLFSS